MIEHAFSHQPINAAQGVELGTRIIPIAPLFLKFWDLVGDDYKDQSSGTASRNNRANNEFIYIIQQHTTTSLAKLSLQDFPLSQMQIGTPSGLHNTTL